MSQKLASPENQPVTFIELFFDLVFVFALTQLVVFFYHDLTFETGIQVLLIFWLVWWSWTQFTWALNSANTRHSLIELMVLIATIIAFFMAIFIPNSFKDQAILFAIAYVTTRMIGFTIYGLVASENELQLQAV
ncbi:MAG: low temperature requirement protein A, partial [Candidatus Heimdallarchaeota archaeon]